MTQINAYITFNGNCREAMTFYKESIGGELILMTVKDSPMSAQWPAGVQHNILHASLTKNNLVLLGSDMTGPVPLINGNTISLSLTCSSAGEANTFFNSLSAGGKVFQPLHQFFAGTMGAFADKFGMNWLIYYGKN